MTTAAANQQTTVRRPGFYTVMGLVVAAIVAAGFGPSYAHGLAPPGLPVWVHLHGAVMSAWITLFVVQTVLVGRANLALHRRLGWLSTGLIATMVPLGLATTMLAVRRHATPPFFTDAMMMSADAIDLAAFAGLFVAALCLRRQAQWHKRLLLCATVLLTWPALARLLATAGVALPDIIPMSVFALFALALIGPVFDLATRRSVHPAYLIGVATIIITQPLHALLAASGPMQALAHRLGG